MTEDDIKIERKYSFLPISTCSLDKNIHCKESPTIIRREKSLNSLGNDEEIKLQEKIEIKNIRKKYSLLFKVFSSKITYSPLIIKYLSNFLKLEFRDEVLKEEALETIQKLGNKTQVHTLN